MSSLVTAAHAYTDRSAPPPNQEGGAQRHWFRGAGVPLSLWTLISKYDWCYDVRSISSVLRLVSVPCLTAIERSFSLNLWVNAWFYCDSMFLVNR